MRINKLLLYIMSAIRDPERDFSERIFIIFSIISEAAALIALLGDVLTGESYAEILTLFFIVVSVPLITLICLYRNRMGVAIKLLVTTLVFAILPALFFFGGGITGGGFLWIIFGFMYVGLVVSGRMRKIFLVLMFVLTTVCFIAAYFHPEWVWGHSRFMHFVDVYISVILVGIVCFFMTWSQNQLFMEENKRAKAAAAQAEELTRSQNRFFSSMSHEIRTPINSILGLNELILRDPDASDSIIRNSSGISGAGKLLLALINDILDFSKMEAGSMDIVPVDYRVGDMLSEIVNMIWKKADDKGLDFNVTIDPKVPSVLYGDEVRIKQIIINLLNNAIKYTNEGSVSLHMESADTTGSATTLSISISDTGIGIRRESIPHLFDVFKRVDQEKNRYIEGTGLGLSIVKQLVELMGGDISVNSVYGEGSTFSVRFVQGISDSAEVGELNIHNQQVVKHSRYESMFKAPYARILIVDDNEMNLEVEKKLIIDTELTIDTVTSGKEALVKSLKNHYDVILMDHLMPEMDGIECLEAVRDQVGGLNRQTPVVVVTANAGSENRDLYNRSGFDDYLIKPVSGEALEEMLMKHIPRYKLQITGKLMKLRADINTVEGYVRKAPVIITSTSMCDLPDAIIRKLNLPILPFLIKTDEGVFKDGVQMDSNELIRYINNGRNAGSMSPDINTYTEFFSQALKKAHNLIHISITDSMSDDYSKAFEAAKAFDNVAVLNSECLSSATGILVLIAYKLAKQDMPILEIMDELNMVKRRLQCSFIIKTTDYMAKKGLISARIHNIAGALDIHPFIKFKDYKYGIGGISMGNTKRAYKKYIHKALPAGVTPDPEVVFITYADVPMDTLKWIKEEINSIVQFEHVVYKRASAAISSNCGPGAFGILYFVKTDKRYNIGSLFREEEERINDNDDNYGAGETKESEDSSVPSEPSVPAESASSEWYDNISGLDGKTAIKNSGSEEAFRTVLKIFYDSIPAKTEEINGFYESGDWKNYTVKVHALKSSAKLIGALGLADEAQRLETAGKEGDLDYIKLHHVPFMEEYGRFDNILSESVFKAQEEEQEDEKPVADDFIMESVYEGLREAAEAMDSDAIDEMLEELSGYAIPAHEQEKFDEICRRVEEFDYDGILEML